MGAILSGMSLHEGIRPLRPTFLIFSETCGRPSACGPHGSGPPTSSPTTPTDRGGWPHPSAGGSSFPALRANSQTSWTSAPCDAAETVRRGRRRSLRETAPPSWPSPARGLPAIDRAHRGPRAGPGAATSSGTRGGTPQSSYRSGSRGGGALKGPGLSPGRRGPHRGGEPPLMVPLAVRQEPISLTGDRVLPPPSTPTSPSRRPPPWMGAVDRLPGAGGLLDHYGASLLRNGSSRSSASLPSGSRQRTGPFWLPGPYPDLEGEPWLRASPDEADKPARRALGGIIIIIPRTAQFLRPLPHCTHFLRTCGVVRPLPGGDGTPPRQVLRTGTPPTGRPPNL